MPRFPKKPLTELIQILTVCDWAPDGWDVRWVVDPLPMEGLRNDTLGAWIELSMTPTRSRGVDDYRQQWNPDVPVGGALQSVFYGLRQFTLTCDARSLAPDIPAWDILECVRLRMNNPASLQVNGILRPNNLSWIRTHPMVGLNFVPKNKVDRRQQWRATMDIEFGWLSAAQDPTNPGGVIDTVGPVPTDSPAGTVNVGLDAGSVISNPDGNPWPTP